MKKYEIRYNDPDVCTLRATEEGEERFIEGYATVFNTRSKLIFENRQLFNEEIRPGSFAEVLGRGGLDVIFTFNHSKDIVLARTGSGTLQLQEDDKGLFYRARIDVSDSEAKNLWLRIKRGDLSENSFAFRVDESDYQWERAEDGTPIRVIHRISDLRDVSAVTYAAYPETSVNARELDDLSKDESEEDTIRTKEMEDLKLKTRIKIIQLKNKNQ